MAVHPYTDLPDSAYWRSAVASRNPLEASDLWVPKTPLSTEDKVVTFGSCFAQHISRALKASGFSWLDTEPGPKTASDELKNRFGYGVFSSRTGNIYTARALLQWLEWSTGAAKMPTEIWEKDGRFYDPFRPAIEPNGFATKDEVQAARTATLAAFKRAATEANVFVFTMGLTEAWENTKEGYTYATCPGTNAGTFDPDLHVFRNYDYPTIYADLERTLAILRKINPGIRVLLTVSPVPLTATAVARHVVVFTTYSKSVLRAVAGALVDANDDVDYFPSYEIITAPSFRGMFFDPNMRTVSYRGVAFVMEHFMAPLASPAPANTAAPVTASEPAPSKEDDLVCEEAILEAFAPGARG